jgi:hypothetical protein
VRRKFFGLAQLGRAPLAVEALRQIDAIFSIERGLNGLAPAQRLAERHTRIASLLADLEAPIRTTRAKLSRHAKVAKAMDYMLIRWPSFGRFVEDGRSCLPDNAAKRALRDIALDRKAWLFAGSDRGGERAAAIYSHIATAKLNGVDPRAWLADILARINDHPAARLRELLPRNWKTPATPDAAAA